MANNYPLKCKYYEKESPIRILPGIEYLVTFKCLNSNQAKLIIFGQEFPPEDEAWCIVRREDVKPLKGDSGIVKISVYEFDKNKGTAEVGIFNHPDQQIDRFLVPLSEISAKEDVSQE